MVVKTKIVIGAKKRKAEEAGLSHEAKIDSDVVDTSAAHETGMIDKYDEIPQATPVDDEKKRLKKEYQKRKLKKQRQSKKGFDIVREDTDLVRLSTESDAIDFNHHLGIQMSKKTDELKQIKKKSRLGRALLNDNEDEDVLVSQSATTTNTGALEACEALTKAAKLAGAGKKAEGDEKKKKGKREKKDKKETKSTTTTPDQSQQPQLTKRQKRKELKKVENKSGQNSMLNSEHNRQLALLGMVAEKQESWAETRVKKEVAKIEHLNDKEQKKIEKKERERKIKNLMLEQVRIKRAAEKQEAKALRDDKGVELIH